MTDDEHAPDRHPSGWVVVHGNNTDDVIILGPYPFKPWAQIVLTQLRCSCATKDVWPVWFPDKVTMRVDDSIPVELIDPRSPSPIGETVH